MGTTDNSILPAPNTLHSIHRSPNWKMEILMSKGEKVSSVLTSVVTTVKTAS